MTSWKAASSSRSGQEALRSRNRTVASRPSRSLPSTSAWSRERVEQGGALQRQGGIALLPEDVRPGPRRGGVQQTHVPHRAGLQGPDEAEEIIEVEVLDLAHTVPSRWSTLPHLSISRASAFSTSSSVRNVSATSPMAST